MKQKSQLIHHVFMVAAENRQLWNRLTRLTKTNKSLGSQLTKISDTLKQHPTTQPLDILSYSFCDISDLDKPDDNKKHLLTIDNGLYKSKNSKKNFLLCINMCIFCSDDKEQSLEEISLRLINNIMLEKSALEQQYAEVRRLY